MQMDLAESEEAILTIVVLAHGARLAPEDIYDVLWERHRLAKSASRPALWRLIRAGRLVYTRVTDWSFVELPAGSN